MEGGAGPMGAGWNFHTTYTSLPKAFYRRLPPAPAPKPQLLLLNEGLARELGLDPEALRGDEGAALFSGNRLPEGAESLAMAYAGHQFGGFTMLGDGRALLIGEHVTPAGERFDIQLKGSGPTPYSRGGDGRAALGPMLREYIISEAMHGLGIPTTRSLAVAATGEAVLREKPLRGAVLTRVARSHLRVGTFQFAAAWHGSEAVRALADYALQRHFPEGAGEPDRYLELLRAVSRRQAELVARWQLVGFIHGVMNTDNMSIPGETIDYGPCAFMDEYDPATVFSSIDRRGRYAYGNQPPIAQWNLARFADTLLPLLHDDEAKAIESAQEEISAFPALFKDVWLAGMREKLGLRGRDAGDLDLVNDLLALMQQTRADYTNVFRRLTLQLSQGASPTEPSPGTETLFASEQWPSWRKRWRARIGGGGEGAGATDGAPTEAVDRMKRANPAVIPRNHLVEEALEAAAGGDLEPTRRLLRAVTDPYAYGRESMKFVELPDPDGPAYVTYCGT